MHIAIVTVSPVEGYGIITIGLSEIILNCTAGPACDLAEAPRCTAMPSVDWSRYHLNILFVDRYA